MLEQVCESIYDPNSIDIVLEKMMKDMRKPLIDNSISNIKMNTKKEIEMIPSFIASSEQTHIISNVSKNKYEQIEKILSYYVDQSFDIQENEDDVILTKTEKLPTKTYSISKMSIPEFDESFQTNKMFDPILINTDKKNCLGENLETIIKNLILNPHIKIEEDLEFKTLKEMFSLKGEDDYVIKKDDMLKLQKYCKSLNRTSYVGSEKVRLGQLSGLTDFRIGNVLYDIRNRSIITKRDFYQLYIYAVILNEILGIKIEKLIILSPLTGEEYTMYFILHEKHLDFIKNFQMTETEI